jgi:hypothetical protein
MSPPLRMQDELGGYDEAPPPAAPGRPARRFSTLNRALALLVFVILVIFAALAGAGLGAAYAYRQLGQAAHGAAPAAGGKP